jgi:hypothetical protein
MVLRLKKLVPTHLKSQRGDFYSSITGMKTGKCRRFPWYDLGAKMALNDESEGFSEDE